jgi:hypothetical protein
MPGRTVSLKTAVLKELIWRVYRWLWEHFQSSIWQRPVFHSFWVLDWR